MLSRSLLSYQADNRSFAFLRLYGSFESPFGTGTLRIETPTNLRIVARRAPACESPNLNTTRGDLYCL